MNLLSITQMLIAITLSAALYKIYLDSKLSDETGRGDVMTIFTRIYSIRHFFPISKKKFGKENQMRVKNANRALYTFYVCFVLAIVTVLIDAFL